MDRRLKLLLALLSSFLFLLLLLSLTCRRLRLRWARRRRADSLEAGGLGPAGGGEAEPEDLVAFPGGEGLTAHDVLDAPGEVVGKSGYATLYRASLQRADAGGPMLLRFVRPAACAGRTEAVMPVVRAVGSVRHPNLVLLRAVYVGPRGEKLFVHPFYQAGSLAQFLQDENAESHRWEVVYKLSLGIAKGLEHLHSGLQKPIIHGNLKSKNIFLDSDRQPRLSDFGLHLLLNLGAAQEMLDACAADGYKAPELIKMKDATKETDVYSLGIVLLELITRKQPMNGGQDLHLPASLRNLVLDHKISDIFSSDLISSQSENQCTKEEGLLMCFQLAMACYSPTPGLRPDQFRRPRRHGPPSRQGGLAGTTSSSTLTTSATSSSSIISTLRSGLRFIKI